MVVCCSHSSHTTVSLLVLPTYSYFIPFIPNRSPCILHSFSCLSALSTFLPSTDPFYSLFTLRHSYPCKIITDPLTSHLPLRGLWTNNQILVTQGYFFMDMTKSFSALLTSKTISSFLLSLRSLIFCHVSSFLYQPNILCLQ